MFVLIFFSFKADAAKLSIPVIDLIVDKKRLTNLRKFIFCVLCIMGIVILLCITISIGLNTYPLLVIFGFLSFSVTLAIIMLLAFICAILSVWRYVKVDFKSLKDSMFGASLQTRFEAGKSLRAINDPVLNKIGKIAGKIGLFCLLAWFTILVLAICVVLYLDHIGIWRELIDK